MNNADLAYRPLIGGTSILNARIDEPGTLGCIAQDATGLWLISAYHVLCEVNLGAFVGEENIYQPAAEDPDGIIAVTKPAKTNIALDCAAALLQPGIAGVGRQLGLGTSTAPKEPVVGMHVVKSGAVTGITEGVISLVNGDDITICLPPAYDNAYIVSDAGDSGSVWLEQATLAPVALHRGHITPRTVRASRMLAVLAALHLQLP